MSEIRVLDCALSHNEDNAALAERRDRHRQLRETFQQIRKGESPGDPLTLTIKVVDVEMQQATSRMGILYESVVVIYDQERRFSLLAKRSAKKSAYWTNEAELLMSLEIGSTYEVICAVNAEGFVEWVSAELIEDPLAH